MDFLGGLLKGAFKLVFQLLVFSFIGGYLLGSYMGTIKTLDRSMEIDLWRAPAYTVMTYIPEDAEKYKNSWFFSDLVKINPKKAELQKQLFKK